MAISSALYIGYFCFPPVFLLWILALCHLVKSTHQAHEEQAGAAGKLVVLSAEVGQLLRSHILAPSFLAQPVSHV